jgi:hypothetical protein
LAWWNNNTNYRVGQFALTGLVLENYRQSNRGFFPTVQTALALGGIWYPQISQISKYGLGSLILQTLRATVFSSYGLAAGIPLVIGAGVSYAIDPEEGLDNYGGFVFGGTVGNDPNYWDSDNNNSGYFNVNQNFVNIISANRRAESERVRKEAEAEYIQRYWERKAIAQQVAAEQNYGILLASYNGLTDAQKRTYLAMYQDLLSPN